MTRVKKTRSLKRIHKTKTGSISKFKKAARDAGSDRQVGKRVKGRKVLSVYEKFLQDNPEAREKNHAQPSEQEKVVPAEAEKRPRKEHEESSSGTSLLDQLDNKNLNDFY